MKELDARVTKNGNTQTFAGNYRLEYFNGICWELGHPEHWNITHEEWLEMRTEFVLCNRNTKWRLIRMDIVESGGY